MVLGVAVMIVKMCGDCIGGGGCDIVAAER